jgi:7,8-dihydropterin-6-yl-methyl-4-(beta-D-ribofuranosyl)aminobenzene 5'-phosphate synthase
MKREQGRLRLQVVFNNIPYQSGLQTGWGFSCLITGPQWTVLFDTGGDGRILLANMQRLGLAVEELDAVVLSHIHGDHTGGLEAILARKPNLTVFMPRSFPASFGREVARYGAAVEIVAGPRRLMEGLHSTGEMGRAIKEQALIVDAQPGLIVLTGCAHPGVENMAEQAMRYRGAGIYLLMGGFHLGGLPDAQLEAVIKQLKTLRVKKVAPSHCTGDRAMAMFRAAWGRDFVAGGLGAMIEVPC